ncbi:hypothetical protein E6C27_scaffold34G00770 [Cucumis melo var. makuwa]|uniref:Uncharacterized protein n=1 Tax=Cucumis melo var. makuwa TaxID=1194695 RepID=A0A5A7SL11_CUCMM|nr:hypothetical protein E6C27_scaffold34G00770 [Cucumis melo var. makuwa]
MPPSPREFDSRASPATIPHGSEVDPPRRSLPNETPVGPRLLRLQVVAQRRVPSLSSPEQETLQAEPIPAFLVEPIRLSLSRQPALDLAAWKAHFPAVRTRWANLQPIRVVPAWVSFGITTYLGLRSPTGPPVWHGYRYDSSDSTGSSQPDCLSVSSGFATDQYVLSAPSGHRRPDSVPTGAHVARVQERASRGRGKGKGKLASDQK